MKRINSYEGAEFEVTEADQALVAPLGTPDPTGLDEDHRMASLKYEIKQALQYTNIDRVLPRGTWDAFLDEGEMACGVADCEDGEMCCNGDHILMTRPSDPDHDSVFVRLHTAVSYESIWDVEVVTRDGHTGQPLDKAVVVFGASGDEYTPDNLINDIGVLLAVFRLYVAQGRI